MGWRWYWGGRRVRDGVGRGGREGGRWSGREVRVLLYS